MEKKKLSVISTLCACIIKKKNENMADVFYVTVLENSALDFLIFISLSFQVLFPAQVPSHMKLCTKLHKWDWANHFALVSYQMVYLNQYLNMIKHLVD